MLPTAHWVDNFSFCLLNFQRIRTAVISCGQKGVSVGGKRFPWKGERGISLRGKKPCLVVTRVPGKLIAHLLDELRIAMSA